MIIKKLNSMFHRHSRVLFGAFTLIIIVSFMGFLTPGQFGCGGYGGGNSAVGEVYGKKVSIEELNAFARMYPLFSSGDNVEWNEIFRLYCLNFRADQLGIHVSDEEVADEIKPLCTDKDGKYDAKIYRQLVENLEKRGIGENGFTESKRLEIKLRKLSGYAASQVVVTPSEIENLYKELNTKLHFKVASFKPGSIAAPTDKELNDLFLKEKDLYRCAKIAVFPVGKDVKAAEKRAYEFYREAKQSKEGFDKAAKKKNVKILPEQWMTRPARATGGAMDKLTAAIFSASPEKPVAKIIRSGDAIYVGCWIDKSEKEEFTGIKAKLETRWRAEKTRKMAEDEAKRLNAIADRALREKAFMALKNATITDKVENVTAGIRDGEALAADGKVYLLLKREIPDGPVPDKEKASYGGMCRFAKTMAAEAAFEEDLNSNCKFFMNREGGR